MKTKFKVGQKVILKKGAVNQLPENMEKALKATIIKTGETGFHYPPGTLYIELKTQGFTRRGFVDPSDVVPTRAKKTSLTKTKRPITARTKKRKIT